MRNYLLLTPGPLSTSESVRQAMLQDWCTWPGRPISCCPIRKI